MQISAVCVLLYAAGALPAATLDGKWEVTVTQFGEPDYGRLTLKMDGEKVAGQWEERAVEGNAHGEGVTFAAHEKDGKLYGEFKGTLLEGVLVGTAKVRGESASWTAQRPLERPAGARTEHRFFTRTYHRQFSRAIPAVMRIFPGDTVVTSTIDAEGIDGSGTRRSQGGNPLTGPFYIENAWPGDTLVVRFTRIRLNRDSAIQSDSIVGNALDPYYFKDVKRADGFDSDWKLDRDRSVATLKNPSEKLKKLALPVAPMLGCVGVAPPGNQSFSSGHLGSFGGNMDYNQIREGVTLYLPVYHPGALLFVGDGHAVQGDAELTGNALETSMDVEFSVDVVEGHAPDMPRAENSDYIMALGIGGSLQDALQAATTNLGQWLERDYKLNASEVAIVLGTSVRYDIAEIVDGPLNVVAKVSKSVLSQIGR